MTHLNGYEMLALFKVVISQADAALPRFHAQIMTQLAEHGQFHYVKCSLI